MLTPENLEKVRASGSNVERKFAEALHNDDDFIQALLYATGSANASNSRIRTLASIMKEVIDAETPAP
jgi:hypothetical protein